MTSEILLPPVVSFVVGYLLGAIPFGLVLTWAAGLGDVRAIGSGNIGATNVLRTGRKGLAAATMILDAAKGAVAIFIAGLIFPSLPQAALIAAIGAFLGHLYPVWLRFKGGKGVATLVGIVAALCWPAALVVVATWLALFAAARYSSLAGMAASIAAPAAAFAFGRYELLLPFTGFALLVLWKHRTNIGRLLKGAEPKVSRRAG
jgi:acyl phosphate:glycerol-3-phosphate acyltransferase